MSLLAIDPGNVQSAYVELSDGRIYDKGILVNADMRRLIEMHARDGVVEECVIEMVASYGMPVGREVFDTCVAIGEFREVWRAAARKEAHLRPRRDVKMFLCGANNAKDSNIRQALLDMFGPGKEKAVGVKRAPGPLFGVSKDVWAALALAVTHAHSAKSTYLEISR